MNTTQLRAQRTSLMNSNTTLAARGLKTEEQRKAFEANEAEIESLTSRINLLDQIEAKQSRNAPVAPTTQDVVTAVNRVPLAVQRALGVTASGAELPVDKRAVANDVMRRYIRTGVNHRDLLTTSDAAGAAFIPQEFNSDVTYAQKAFAPLLQFAEVKKTRTGAPAKFPFVDDTANGLVLNSESTQLNEGLDPTFGSKLVHTDLMNGGLVRVSNQSMDDSDFDFGDVIKKLALGRMYRGVEKILTTGKDSSGNSLSNNPGMLSFATVATTTSAISAGIGYTDIVNVYDALDAAYLPTAVWQLSSKSRTYLLGLKDTTGRPLYVPAPTADGLDMLLGRPVVINQSLPSPTAGVFTASTLPILFGSLEHSLAVKIDESPSINLLRERFAELNESAFTLAVRVGSASLLTSALQSLKIASA